MEMRKNMEQVKQQKELVEKWYEWLCSNPSALFQPADITRMREPALYFHQSINWLHRTTIFNTEWFIQEASQMMMNRWLKDDYDVFN